VVAEHAPITAENLAVVGEAVATVATTVAADDVAAVIARPCLGVT
jgi:hypothetical protein